MIYWNPKKNVKQLLEKNELKESYELLNGFKWPYFHKSISLSFLFGFQFFSLACTLKNNYNDLFSYKFFSSLTTI
jgi:hypothetical protein